MLIARLILHGLFAVALLGALTHQSVAVFLGSLARGDSFVSRYAAVPQSRFTGAVIVLYLVTFGLGSTLYPSYRVDVRIPFEEMSLGWAVGLFEIKEHIAALGLGCLPLYWRMWRSDIRDDHFRDRKIVTLFLATIVWLDFLVGHVLNDVRGLT